MALPSLSVITGAVMATSVPAQPEGITVDKRDPQHQSARGQSGVQPPERAIPADQSARRRRRDRQSGGGWLDAGDTRRREADDGPGYHDRRQYARPDNATRGAVAETVRGAWPDRPRGRGILP